MEEIEALKNGHGKRVVEDFGSATMNGETIWVEFEDEFSSKLVNGEIPVVSITANALGAEIAVIEKTSNGFRVRKIGTNPLSFDWFAKAKIKSISVAKETGNTSISESVKNQLHLPQSVKDQVKMFDVYEAETQARLKIESEEDQKNHELPIEEADNPDEFDEVPSVNNDDPALNGTEAPIEEKEVEAADEFETPEETIRKENMQPKAKADKAIEPSKQQSPRRN